MREVLHLELEQSVKACQGQGTNALAYYKNSYLTAAKSFMTLAPGHNVEVCESKLLSQKVL